jgi:hypothetical protein
MDAKEYTGWHHGTSKQHAAPLRKSKTKTQEKNKKLEPYQHMPFEFHFLNFSSHPGPFVNSVRLFGTSFHPRWAGKYQYVQVAIETLTEPDDILEGQRLTPAFHVLHEAQRNWQHFRF